MAPDEPEEIEATSQFLVREFTAWAATRERESDPEIVELAVTRRQYGPDVRFNFWTPAIVQDLLSWLPWQGSLGPEDAPLALETVRQLLRFLADTDLLDPRGGSLEENLAAVDAAAEEFRDALADPERPDPELPEPTTTPTEAASEPDADEEALQALLQQLLDSAADSTAGSADAPLPPLPPVQLPSESDLVVVAERSPAVRRVRTLYQWLGEHELRVEAHSLLPEPADGEALAELLDLPTTRLSAAPDDATVDPRPYPLGLLLRWAAKTELIRVRDGVLVPASEAKPLLSDPLTLWRRAYDVVLDGELAHELFPMDGSDLEFLLNDETLEDIANTLYGMQPSFPASRLSIVGAVDDEQTLDSEKWAVLRQYVDRALDLLADLGALRSELGVPDPLFASDLDDSEPDGMARLLNRGAREELRATLAEEDRLITLTGLGHWGVHHRLRADGREAPLIGELADAPAAGLLTVLGDHYDPYSAETEIDIWLEHNQAKVDDLLAALRANPFRTRAAAITHLLLAMPNRGSELSTRMLSDTALQPYALLVGANMLQDSDDPDPTQLDDDDPRVSPLTMVESLLQLLETAGPDGFSETLRNEVAEGLPELATALAISTHPDVNGVSRLRQLVAELTG